MSVNFCLKALTRSCVLLPALCTSLLLSGAPAHAADKVLATKTGVATFYGQGLEGKKTASGRIFDKEQYVAAHPSYPFGTIVRITNLENHKSVKVCIVDRGPSRRSQRKGVIIDLSRQAAKSLDYLDDGRARVHVQVLAWGEKKPAQRLALKD
jgi:rare lipoprotein A